MTPFVTVQMLDITKSLRGGLGSARADIYFRALKKVSRKIPESLLHLRRIASAGAAKSQDGTSRDLYIVVFKRLYNEHMRQVLSRALGESLELPANQIWTTVDIQDAAVALSPVVRSLQLSRSQLLKNAPLSVIGRVMDLMAREPESREPEWWLDEKKVGLLRDSCSGQRGVGERERAFVMLIHHTIRILEDAIRQVRGTVSVTSFQNVRRHFETYISLLCEGTQATIFYQSDTDVELLCNESLKLFPTIAWTSKTAFLMQKEVAPNDPSDSDDFSRFCYMETVAQPASKKRRGPISTDGQRGFSVNVSAGNTILLDVLYMIECVGSAFCIITDLEGMKTFKKFFLLLGARKNRAVEVSKLFRLLEVLHDGSSCMVKPPVICDMANLVLSHVNPSNGELQTQRRQVSQDERFFPNEQNSNVAETPAPVPGAIVIEDEEDSEEEYSNDDNDDSS